MATKLIEEFVQTVSLKRIGPVVPRIKLGALVDQPFQYEFGFGNLRFQKEDRSKISILIIRILIIFFTTYLANNAELFNGLVNTDRLSDNFLERIRDLDVIGVGQFEIQRNLVGLTGV